MDKTAGKQQEGEKEIDATCVAEVEAPVAIEPGQGPLRRPTLSTEQLT
jgi:hypothetical protein